MPVQETGIRNAGLKCTYLFQLIYLPASYGAYTSLISIQSAYVISCRYLMRLENVGRVELGSTRAKDITPLILVVLLYKYNFDRPVL